MPDECQTPAERPPKKRMSRATRVLVIIVCVLLAIALLLVATVLVLSAIGRNALTDDDGMNISRDDVESLGSGTVRYNDRLYRYNTDIVTILLMGVDEQVKQDASGIYGNANQSDANILAVLDLRNQEMTLISISRDAMCTLDILDSAGEHVGTATAQLALAYAYGDGAERSCELTSAAVSRLFYDLPIPVYGSIYMQGIRQLVDSVGGVTVTPDTSIPGFAAGQPVTLTGQLTESYIRYRADSTEGNNQRMQRQKQVVLALMHKMLAQVKEDPASILALYNNVRRNTTTNINTAISGAAGERDALLGRHRQCPRHVGHGRAAARGVSGRFGRAAGADPEHFLRAGGGVTGKRIFFAITLLQFVCGWCKIILYLKLLKYEWRSSQ